MEKSVKVTFLMCGYGKGEKIKDIVEAYRKHSVKNIIGDQGITVANDMLPNDPQELRIEMLNNIIMEAKDNGISKRYLK